GWWKGEGNANDSVDGNNGALVGSVAFVTGEVGQALSLNGSNAYVSVAASSSLDAGTGVGLTIECWIRPDDVTTGVGHAIAEWNDGAGGVGAHLWHAIPPCGGLGSLFANLRAPLGPDH